MPHTRSSFIVQSLLSLAANDVVVPAGSVVTTIVLLLQQAHGDMQFTVNAVGQALRRLERRKVLQRTKQGNSIRFSLTATGKATDNQPFLDDLKLPPRPVNWDGQWRIVLFSIPESNKAIRTVFRSKLQSLGFVSLQRSAWLYPFPAETVVAELIRRLNLTSHVSVIVTPSLKPDEPFLRHFGLGALSLQSIAALPVAPSLVSDEELIPLVELD